MNEHSPVDLGELFATMDVAKAFSQPDQLEIAKCLELCSRKKGEPVLLQGDEGSFLAFIAEGSAGITKDISHTRDAEVFTVNKGGHFGELSMIDGKPRSASVVALEDLTLLCLSRENLDALARHSPETAYKLLLELMKSLSLRLRDTTHELVFKV